MHAVYRLHMLKLNIGKGCHVTKSIYAYYIIAMAHWKCHAVRTGYVLYI